MPDRSMWPAVGRGTKRWPATPSPSTGVFYEMYNLGFLKFK